MDTVGTQCSMGRVHGAGESLRLGRILGLRATLCYDRSVQRLHLASAMVVPHSRQAVWEDHHPMVLA